MGMYLRALWTTVGGLTTHW